MIFTIFFFILRPAPLLQLTWQVFTVSKEPIKSIVDVCSTEKPALNSKLCHVCNECVALIERVSVQHHCETKHQEAYPQMSEVGAHKITEMGVQYDDLPNFLWVDWVPFALI